MLEESCSMANCVLSTISYSVQNFRCIKVLVSVNLRPWLESEKSTQIEFLSKDEHLFLKLNTNHVRDQTLKRLLFRMEITINLSSVTLVSVTNGDHRSLVRNGSPHYWWAGETKRISSTNYAICETKASLVNNWIPFKPFPIVSLFE